MKAANVSLNVVIATDPRTLAEETLELFVRSVRKAIETKEQFCVAISRHIPRSFFELLGEESQSRALSWDKVHLFWVDGCCSSSGLENNSYNLPDHTLILKAGIPAENVHSICTGSGNCAYVASIYEQTIYNVVGLKKNEMPRFDLIMLGMDVDGHVASLFPDTYAFYDTGDLVRVIYFMDSRHTRITLTNSVLCAAFHIAVLVSGEERAETLRKVLTSEPDEVRYPIHAIWPILDKVTWLVDRNAAKFLRPPYLLNSAVPSSWRYIKSREEL